ncbi:MAG: Hsp20 family protein [Atopobiaceae bacterium]|nr:Hsp20 family protein [Atopobiaceae bacterium]
MASMVPYDRYGRILQRVWPTLDDIVEAALEPIASTGTSFKMDVEDTGTGYVVTAELPGVTREQIDVELNEGRLSISVEKTESEENSGKNWIHKETGSWSATRGIYLKDASTQGLSAKLENGVLTVNVPKQEEKVNVTKVSID